MQNTCKGLHYSRIRLNSMSAQANRINRLMDGWMDGRTDRRMDGRTDGWAKKEADTQLFMWWRLYVSDRALQWIRSVIFSCLPVCKATDYKTYRALLCSLLIMVKLLTWKGFEHLQRNASASNDFQRLNVALHFLQGCRDPFWKTRFLVF